MLQYLWVSNLIDLTYPCSTNGWRNMVTLERKLAKNLLPWDSSTDHIWSPVLERWEG